MFSWQFDSNTTAGNFVEDISGQVANNFVRYTDENGELDRFKIYMFDYLDTGDTTFDNYLDRGDLYPKTNDSFINKYLVLTSTNFKVIKDRREILGGTLELEQKSKDNNKVILGRALSYRNRLVSDNPPTAIKLYYSTTRKLKRYENYIVPSDYTLNGTAGILITKTSENINVLVSTPSSTWESWILADEDGKILIGVNQDGTALDTITFDFLNKASDIKYKY